MNIKSYAQFFEAKNIGVIYHFTSLISLYQIIKSNELETLRSLEGLPNLAKVNNMSDDYIYKYYFSFTRNKHFDHPEYSNNIDSILSCRIDIDGTKMSHKYKVIPASFYSNTGKNNYNKLDGSDESEEIVISNDNYLRNITAYITNINICDANIFYNEMLECINSEYEEKIEGVFSWIQEEFGIDTEEMNTIIESPEMVSDIFTVESSNMIYQHIFKFLKSKYPNLKIFKSEQLKLNF